jgi:ParB-like chromosome segregation protein Spo0J
VLIESVPISSLLPDPSNVRRHDEKNLAAIKGSLKKFGQRKPIVARNGVVIAGNGTLAAAQALGWSEIQIVRADDMSATDATAYAIADNRTAELAEWDMESLGSTLQALREDGLDLLEIGFDTGDMEDILKQPGEIIGSTELNEDEFKEFENQCPKCGFEYDDPAT